MTPHDRIVASILHILGPLDGELRLLARVNDAKLGNQSDREVFLFVPDLHLVSAGRQEKFGKYGFNHRVGRVLEKLLVQLDVLARFWRQGGDHKLVTIQLGDFFDLWREFSFTAKPWEIPDDEFGGLRDILYRGRDRGLPCLKATMLLGNHDTKRGVPFTEARPMLRAFDRGPRPFLFATHGDAFDVLEQIMPDAIQEAVVEFIGKLTPLNRYDVGTWGKAAGKTNKKLGDLKKCIQAIRHELPCATGAPVVTPGTPLPDVLAHTISDPAQAADALPEYAEALSAAAAKYPDAGELRVVTIGHTHRAGMTWCEPAQGNPILLMDCGAWIERCRYPLAEGGFADEPNAQLGVIHGNDARIYQVRLPT